MRMFLTATAALAMAATAAQAEPGGGDKGSNKNNGSAAQMKGAGKGNGNPTQMQANGNAKGPARNADRGGEGSDRRGPQQAMKRDNAADRKQMRDTGPPNPDRAERRAERETRGDRRDVRRIDDRRGGRSDRIVEANYRDQRGLIDGCPPGLAKKGTNCTPPGLAKKQGDNRYRDTYYRPDWWGFGSAGDRLYYEDGYLYRLGGNNSVLGYIPLLGGALSVGNVWPSMYQPVSVPNYYADYYNLGPQDSYRYADNVLYRVDPESTAITSIAALLTGDDFTVGQPIPQGYDVYNVPYAYQDRYYDRPDAMYRYSDGYVYQVDPKTRLVAAAIELLI